jgi:cyclopropane fatty-acyl-phospholipid synthase-like methyltransferase
MGAMVEAARGTNLAVTAVRDIGPDYAITLRAWRQAWNVRKQDILALGYSEKFWLKVSNNLPLTNLHLNLHLQQFECTLLPPSC